MTVHAEHALGGACIAQILDLLLAIATSETSGAVCLVASEDGQILDLVAAGAAAVGTVVADERAIAEQEEVGIGVEEGAAGVAAEAVDVPAMSR